MQIVPVLDECGLSGSVTEKLQGSGALTLTLTPEFSVVFPISTITVVFLLLDQTGSPLVVIGAGLAAAA